MKNRFYLYLFCLLWMNTLHSQQLPVYQHSFLIRSLYNPSEIIAKNLESSFYLLKGNQFSKFSGGFQNNHLSFTTPLRKANVGIGLQFANRSFGILSQLSGEFGYAYQAKINDDLKLSLGIRLGIMQQNYNKDYLVIYQTSDNVIDNLGTRNLFPIGNAGLTLVTKIGDIEMSLPQLISNKLIKGSSTNLELIPHLFARYSVDLGYYPERFKFSPILAMRYMNRSKVQFEAGFTTLIQEKIWINANYRSGFSVSIGAGYKINNKINIGYSFERPITNIYSFFNNNHEVVIGYSYTQQQFRKVKKDYDLLSARNFPKSNMDSISQKQELDIAKEYLVLKLERHKQDTSAIAESNAKKGTSSRDYKKIMIEMNLMDSIFQVLANSEEKNVTLPSKSKDKLTNKDYSKENELVSDGQEDTSFLNKESKKIVKNKQPNLWEYVELDGKKSPKGYYLITGIFSNMERAQKFRWNEGTANSNIIVNKSNKYFYVIEGFSETKSIEELEPVIRECQQKNKSYWILEY